MSSVKSETLFFLIEKKGRGWTVKGYYRCDGLKRFAGVFDQWVETQLIQLNKPYTEFKIWLNNVLDSNKAFSIPYICNLYEGGEVYQAVYISDISARLKEKLENRPMDLWGNFIPNYLWIYSLTKEQIDSRR